ncbi:MAG TPA: efflux RND transporter periplasmic adaptor subunit [Burkholderiales bacterium]|nr:efflux RND transporter periplasmic adaptor subunit [Burkholderiales bacterium]
MPAALRARAACAILLVIALAAGCGKKEAPPVAKGPADVTVVTVAPRDVPAAFEYVGTTQSSRQVNIQARVSGFLDKRVYTEGSIVKEGQVLFLMDKKPFQAQVDAAQAQLSKAQAALDVAKANLARVKPLTEAEALSQKDLDDANGNFQSAAASVEGAKAQLETAQLNLSYCTITSPVAGISGAAAQADGTYLNATNSQLTTVAVLSPMWVNFSLSENEVQGFRDQVAKGQLARPHGNSYVVEVVLVDGTVFPHTGRVTFTDPAFNAQTGTFLIRATLDNPQGLLRPNQYVRVRVTGATRPNAILVPQRAVRQGSRGHFVWVVDKDGKAENRPVTVGDWVGSDWHIVEGLHAGDRVVVDGGLELAAGTALNPQPLAAPAAAAAPPVVSKPVQASK